MTSEQLKAEEFDTHIKNGTFRLAFVGMSNAGKSYRSRILSEGASFLWYHVDEKISTALGLKTTEDVSRWMGYPSTPGYQEKERQYLELEDQFTRDAAMQTHGKNLVFDTTGSVIYLTKKTLEVLRENCLIVHVDVGEDSVAQLIERFFKEPKPVVWSSFFDIQPGESEREALRRSYPLLLHDRLLRYRALSHVNVPVSKLYNTSGEETLSIIKNHL